MIVSTWRGKGLTQVGSCFPTSKKEVYLVYINLETDMMYLHGAVLFVGKLTYTKEGGYDMVTYILDIMWFMRDISDIYNFSSKCPLVCDFPWFFSHDDQANNACTKNWCKMRVHYSCILMPCFNIIRLDLGNRFYCPLGPYDRYRWSYNPCSWPYWVAGIISPHL